MKITQKFVVRRVALGPVTGDEFSVYEETFDTQALALSAIGEWYQENLCPSGSTALNWQFLILPVTIVSQ